MNKQEIIDTIAKVAMDNDKDPCILVAFAIIESNLNANAINGSYAGLFQLSNGVGGCSGNDRYNVEKSTLCAIKYMDYNQSQFEKAGLKWKPFYAYLCHQQGLTGAKQTIEASNVAIKDYKRGRALLGNIPKSSGITKDSLVRDWLQYWENRFDNLMKNCVVKCSVSNSPDGSGTNCQVVINENVLKQNNIVTTTNSNNIRSKKRNYYLWA